MASLSREGKQWPRSRSASLGLSEYAQRFAENGIDVSVLRYLTDQAGVGWARKPQLFMKPGDTCEVEIQGLGTLINRVSEEEDDNS